MKKLIAIMVVLALCLSVLPMTSAAGGNIAVVVDARELGWTSANLYYWNAGGTNWPGISMTALPGAEAGWFYAYVPAGANFIPNSNGAQTVNVEGKLTGAGPVCIKVLNTKTGDHYNVDDTTLPSGITVPAEGEKTYIVAGNGNGAWLNGESWNPSAEVNKMTKPGDVYTITFENLPASPTAYEYKITNGLAWDASGHQNWGNGSSNYTFTLTEASNVTITFTGSAASHTITPVSAAPTTYTVSFDANSGSGTMADVTGVSGSYTLPANGFTAPDGKQFAGWATAADGELISGTTINVTADTTLYAKWEDIPVTTYTVTFDANGGTGTMTAVSGVSGSYTLPANGFTAPTNKEFDGWDVSGTTKQPGDTITVSADTTVKAVWKDATPAPSDVTVYLDPNGNWEIDGARFAVYYFVGDTDNGWVSMTQIGDSRIYTAQIPGGYDNVIFCRMNPNSSENNWSNKWNQTGDLTLPSDKDLYTVTAGTWDNGGGTWSTYTTGATGSGNDGGNTGSGNDGGEGGSTPAPTVSYFVAGTENLCGVAWDEKAEANKMTESSGVYTKIYNDVPVGDYEFKVTDGSWTNAWPGQNFKFSVTAACNVTVTFKPDTKEITVSGDGVKLPDPPAAGYYVAGNGAAGNSWVNGAYWDCGNASNKMTEKNGVYTIKYTNVAPGEYEFKVTDGTWNNAWPGENYKFKVTTACDVTVTFNPTTGAVSVKGAGIPSADTADSTNLVALTAVLVLSAAGLAVLTKKKEF